MARSESVVYKGITFRRYPDSESWADRNYYRPDAGHIRRGVRALHREIWIDTFGEIPPGHHIHHRDKDTSNNAPENLECVSPLEHKQQHPLSDEQLGRLRDHIDGVRHLAVAWHRSAEGRAWHSEHGKRAWESRDPVEYVCEYCGKSYVSLHRGTARFCSNNCKCNWRRKAGLDNEERVCPVCGVVYSANRYSSAKTCSRVCGARLRRAGPAGLQPHRAA